MGVNCSAKLWSVNGGAGLEDERKDMGVERQGKGGLNVAEDIKGLIMASLVDVRGYKLGKIQ